jgi:hypothetical protein
MEMDNTLASPGWPASKLRISSGAASSKSGGMAGDRLHDFFLLFNTLCSKHVRTATDDYPNSESFRVFGNACDKGFNVCLRLMEAKTRDPIR